MGEQRFYIREKKRKDLYDTLNITHFKHEVLETKTIISFGHITLSEKTRIKTSMYIMISVVFIYVSYMSLSMCM